MKTLNDYMQDSQTQLYKETGAFFAISDKQFDENKVDGVAYCSLGLGLIVPNANAKKLVDGLEKIYKAAIAQDMAENGEEGVIRRELFNYECFYTGVLSDCVDALADYGITSEEVAGVYKRTLASENIATSML